MKQHEGHPPAAEPISGLSAVKDILTSKIFVFEGATSYVFNADAFAIMEGDLSMLIRRNYISWNDVGSKHKYSLSQKGQDFIFRTFHNEFCPHENEFIIAIMRAGESYVFSFLSLTDNKEYLRLTSD